MVFAERLQGERFLRIRCFCSPQHTNSALYPIIDHAERSAGFARDDSLQTKLDKLDALLRQSWSSAEDSALFVEMLRCPTTDAIPWPTSRRGCAAKERWTRLFGKWKSFLA